MSDSSNEKRRFSRIDFDITATITDNIGNHWQSNLIDISLKGALLDLPEGWQGNIGDECNIELHLHDEVAIHMGVVVAHIENQHIGFRCEHIDFNSITHLRRLMELNLGDAELVNRELSMLSHN